MIKPRFFIIFVTVLAGLSLLPGWGSAASLFKRYVVKRDGGTDLLCRTHIAREGDSVLGFFEQRGDLGVSGFNGYAGIFLRINPHIRDLDRLLKGRRLLVPLRKIAPDSLPGQSTGIVEIPYIVISSVPELLKKHAAEHTVKKGEFLSRLIKERFSDLGPGYYDDALKIFRKINPGVKNLDRIYVGQKLLLPEPSILNKAWFASLFDRGGNIVSGEGTAPAPPTPVRRAGARRAAELLGARLFDRGKYHFPTTGGGEFTLDLSVFPVLREAGGRRVILVGERGLASEKLGYIRGYWKELLDVPVDGNATAGEILKAIRGRERALSGVAATLSSENPRTFVRELFRGMGFSYTPAAGITFPYFGVQVKTVADLASREGGGDIVVDFGDIYGDAAAAIEKSGFTVVSLGRTDDRSEIMAKLMKALGYTYVENPAFSPRPGEVPAKVIKGYYVQDAEARKVFIADGTPDGSAVKLLEKMGIKLVTGKLP